MSKPTVVAMKSTSGLPPVMAAPGLQATGEQPSAPAAASRVAESFGLRQPDPMDGQDGVNDSSNTDIDAFLSRVGTACPGLDPPRPGVDPSWPPLPEGALEVRGEYFRKPDFTVAANGQAVGGQGAEPRTYVQMLSAAMEALGVASKRKAGSACARGLGAALLSATGVGACFVGSRTRRLEPGEIAFFHDADKRPRFVAGGWSLEPNPFHSGFERFDTNQQYIQFEGVIHIVRVQPGTYVRAVRNGHSLLLEAGENNEVGVHVMVEPNFSIVGQLGGAAGGAVHPDGAAVVRVDASHIDASPLHILNVPPDRVIAVTVNRKPHVLFEGRHVIESPTLVAGNDAGLYSLAKSFSVDGMIHYCVVYPGLLGGVKVADRACFVESPRALWFYSPHVEIMEPVALESEMTSFTSLTRLIVDDFKLALIRAKDGALVVLTPGVHVLKRPVIHLATYSTEWKHIREDLTAITADPLDVKLTMTASFRVCDVAAHYKAGDPEQIMRDCAEMAKSTMSEIIRSLRFEETLMAKRVDDGREAHRAEEEKKQQQKEQRDLEGGGIDDFLDEAPPNDIIRDQWDAISSARTATFVEFLKSTYGVQLDRSVWGFQNFDLCSSTHQEMLAQAVFGRAEARAVRGGAGAGSGGGGTLPMIGQKLTRERSLTNDNRSASSWTSRRRPRWSGRPPPRSRRSSSSTSSGSRPRRSARSS